MRKLVALAVSAVSVATIMALSTVNVSARSEASNNPCAQTSFSPGYVAVGLTSTVAAFGVQNTLEDLCTDGNGWELRIPNLGVDVNDHATQAAFDSLWLTNAEAGRLASVDVRVSTDNHADDAQTIFPSAFSVHRGTAWTLAKASPTTIRPNGTVHLTGTISLANWDTRRYDRYPGRGVSVQWRINPGYTITTVATGHADSHGNVAIDAAPPATLGSGYFRLSYGGNAIAGPAVSAWFQVRVS